MNFLRILARAVLRVVFRVEVRGSVELAGNMLVVANHQSFLDPFLIGAFLPLDLTYLVHSTIASRWYFKWPLKFVRHLVVDSANPLAMKKVIALLARTGPARPSLRSGSSMQSAASGSVARASSSKESGTHILIFPEGRVTVTGSRMKVYDGPAFAAAKSGVPILCVHLDGTLYSRFARVGREFPKKWFPKITVTLHQSQIMAMPKARLARERRRLASEQLRRIMQDAEVAAREDTTIPEALLRAVKLHGRRRRLIEDIRGREETLGQLLKMMLALGRLASKWTREGERVGVLMPTATPTVGLILGLMAAGRVPAMLNYTAGREGLENACRIAEIKTIFASRAFVERAKLTGVMENFRAARVMYLEDLRSQFGLADKLWLILFALWVPRAATKRPRPQEMAVVLFTSGSEGKPKGVALSHRSILANCAQVRSVIDFSCRDKFFNALPLFHAFGLTVGAILPLLTGCRVFLYPSPLHYRVIPEVVYDRDCTILFATSTFLGHYARFANPYDFYRIRYVVSGAEKLREEVRSIYSEKFGLRILEGYGATECSPVISSNTPFSNEAGTVGEPLPAMECRLAPVAGIAEGGELHVRGPNVMMGYFLDREPGVLQPPRSEFGEGWYDTGDIVTINQRGAIAIQGRLRRFAKVAGEMVSLEMAERMAAAASPHREHATAAWRDQARGELIVLFTEDPNLKREHLQSAARELGLPEIAIPRRLVYLDELPVLGNGKKDYVKLQAMAAEAVGR
jgi:acyl-[acyl-carrier-protein]-phospholipid O-acyltransferase/long-chain-fatty-acid--[acyl-carrier-protein] ligase